MKSDGNSTVVGLSPPHPSPIGGGTKLLLLLLLLLLVLLVLLFTIVVVVVVVVAVVFDMGEARRIAKADSPPCPINISRPPSPSSCTRCYFSPI